MKKITRSINVVTVKAMFVNVTEKTITETSVTVVGDNDKAIKSQLAKYAQDNGLALVTETERTVENKLYEMTEADFVKHGTCVGTGRLADK
mgnify:CR=1 FL=1